VICSPSQLGSKGHFGRLLRRSHARQPARHLLPFRCDGVTPHQPEGPPAPAVAYRSVRPYRRRIRSAVSGRRFSSRHASTRCHGRVAPLHTGTLTRASQPVPHRDDRTVFGRRHLLPAGAGKDGPPNVRNCWRANPSRVATTTTTSSFAAAAGAEPRYNKNRRHRAITQVTTTSGVAQANALLFTTRYRRREAPAPVRSSHSHGRPPGGGGADRQYLSGPCND